MNTQILNESMRTYMNDNPWILLVILWIVIWKGLALWQASRRDQKIWFVALLIVNTFGILEICYLVYIYFENKKKEKLN